VCRRSYFRERSSSPKGNKTGLQRCLKPNNQLNSRRDILQKTVFTAAISIGSDNYSIQNGRMN
jgi:hypothetical protein